MLRDIYLSAGGVGTFIITIGMFVTFIGWWMAITEAVTRESLRAGLRVVIILLISILPPLGVLVAAFFIRQDARKVTRAMQTMPDSKSRAQRMVHLPGQSCAAKAA